MEAATVTKKAPNEDIGHVTCTYCKTQQPVRRNAKKKLYINCSNDGVIQPALPHFQSWMMDNATLYGPGGKPDVAPREVPPPKTPEPDRRDTPTLAVVPTPTPTQTATPPKVSATKRPIGMRLFK